MRKSTGVVVLASAIVFVFWAWGGPLEPTGPPAPTDRMAIFQTDIPLLIDMPGSYVVKEPLTGVPGQNGITIDADDVTIDLNGFALTGVPGSLDGIRVTSSRRNITITKGSVRAWGDDGVDLSSAVNSQVIILRAEGNGAYGVRVGQGSAVIHTTAQNNTVGIATGSGSTVIGCTAHDNGTGINTGSESTISDSTAFSNDSDGFLINTGTTLIGCTASNNGADGIRATGSARISNCIVHGNAGDGIQIFEHSFVTGNDCFANNVGPATDAGIKVTGSGNRIEDNNVTDNDIGIQSTGGGNMIVGNTAGGVNQPVDYDLSAGDTFGPIVNVIGIGDISPIANANHPWANFKY